MRRFLTALLIGCAAMLVAAPIAASDPTSEPTTDPTSPPTTCPPACDTVPTAAWPDSWMLPVDSVQHWPALGDVAVPVTAAAFGFEELCATPPVPDDPRRYAVAARATVGPALGPWRLRAQIVHWRGETWRAGQLAGATFDTAVAALRACQVTAPWLSPSVTTAGPDRLAAVISGPVVAHQYLLVDPRSGTISELLFSRDAGIGTPEAPWPAVPDDEVFDAMSAALCRAYLGSCG